MSVNNARLQTAILKVLADPHISNALGTKSHQAFLKAVHSQFPYDPKPGRRDVMAAVWGLVSQRLAYIDYSNPNPENWIIILTDAGSAAARDEEMNPDNSDRYLERLRSSVPAASQTVLQYARESVTSYNSQCYLASAVMLGVASEAAFLEMARSFGNWLSNGQRQRFLKIIDARSNYIAKFVEFRKRVEPLKQSIPGDLSDGMSLTLDSVLDLLRIYRNEAGHPTGKQVTREDAFINLQMFARYLQKLYDLKAFFDSGQLKT